MGTSLGCMNKDASTVSQYYPPSVAIPHVFKAQYTTDATLGKGSYSVVKLGINKQTSEKCAVKIVRKEGLLAVDDLALHQEVEILRSIQHPNIVRCLDFFDEERHYFMILELMEGGELFQQIIKRSSYSEKDARDVVKVVLSGIKYCHDRNIVHRDLKPENLLLKSQDNYSDIKIADFGFASTHGDLMKTQLGTPAYIAPEILEDKSYSKGVDMWSMGVITYMLLGGYPPFQDNNLRALFRKIRTGAYTFHPENWSLVSDEAKDFIRGLLCVDPTKRLTADEALHHPWLKVSDDSLSLRSLEMNLPSFKTYLAKRKFRSAVLTVMAVQKMQNLAKKSIPKQSIVENQTISSSTLHSMEVTRNEVKAVKPPEKTSTKSSSYFSSLM